MGKSYKAITEIPAWANLLIEDGVPDSIAVLYSSVPYLYRLVQLRCDTLSSVPVELYDIKDGDRQEPQPWPYPTSLQELLWRWEASALLSGAAYGEIVTNNSGYQKDVRYRNPFNMSVRYADGRMNFKQNGANAIWTNDIVKGVYQMFYLAEFDPAQDLLPGVSAGKASNIDAKLLYALAKFPELYFEGGAMPVTLLGIDSTDKNEITRVEEWFKRSATALKNAFRVLGIRAGSITPTTLTPKLKDLMMPELSAEAKHNLAIAFGVPKTLLDSEAANYATAVEDRKSFYTETILPRCRKYESVLNEQLLSKDRLQIVFNVNEIDLFQEDENKRAELIQSLTLAGLPIELAMELAGYNLSDAQMAMLTTHQEQQDTEDIPAKADTTAFTAELARWQRMADKRIKEGREIRTFETDIIPRSLHASIDGALETARSTDDVKAIFEQASTWEAYP